MQGQICLNSDFGSLLYTIMKNNKNIKTVVEIGTWMGMGSTKCIIDGLSESNKNDIKFYSLECNKEMFNISKNAWQSKLPTWASIIHGSIVNIENLDSQNLGYQHQDELKWYEDDRNSILSCDNVLHLLPEKIDFLLLDGGEFSTYAEFKILDDRSNIIAIDDTLARKCKKIREEVLNNLQKYKIILDNPKSRNGFMIFQKR